MVDLPVLLPNGGWDPRVLAFASGTTVTVFAVLARRWTVLVDTLYSEAGARALAESALDAARRRVGGATPPLLVVNTHADWDHAWGNGVFAGPEAAFPAPVLGSAECARRMAAPEAAEELARMAAAEPARFAGASLVPPTVRCEGRLEVAGGDLTLCLLPAPGHTPDQWVVWIPEIRTLLGADAVEDPLPFVQGPGHLEELVGTLRALQALEPRVLLPCHAPPDGDPSLLDRNLDYFARVREAVRLSPGVPSDHPDPESALGFPFSDLAGSVPEEVHAFYREGHVRALRAALAEGPRG